MTTRKSGIFALAIATAVMAACEGDTTLVVPEPAVEVSVVPAAIQIDSGRTGTLVAVVRNATNTAVNWTSSDNNVATVNASGVVTGVRPGQATITATSAQDPTAKNAASVDVRRPSGQGGEGQPTIAIRSVTAGSTNNPVPVNNVVGQIDVTVEYTIPSGSSVSRLEVLVDQTVACSQSFSGAGSLEVDASALTIICSINTAEVDANGAVRYPNGPHVISARLVTGAGQVAATSSTNLTFNNTDQLALTVTASGATANDAQGLVWTTGDVTATATPAIFSGTTGNVARVIFTVRNANDNTVIATIEDTSAPFSATFSRTATAQNVGQNVAGVEAPIYVTAASVTAGGQPGPQGQNGTVGQGALRLDNQAPDTEPGDPAAAFNNPGWFSTTTALTGTARVANLGTLDDEGVGRVTTSLQYNTDPAAANNAAGWTSFTEVGALPETNTTSELAFRAVVCDALNNCTNVGPVQSGVDRTAPSIRVEAGPSNNAINPGANLQIVGTDAISGVSIVRARISGLSAFAVDANPDTDLRCYNVAGTVVAAVDGVCPTSDAATIAGPGATETQATVVIPADQNWYTLDITTVDIAGNTSTTTVTRSYLVDTVVPTATISSTTITGTNSSISGTVQDNIQVRAYDSRFLFPGLTVPNAIPFSGTTAVAASLANPLTGQTAATATSSLVVRELREGVAGGAIAPTQYGFGVFDMANNFGFNGAGIGFGAGDGVANTAALDVAPSPAILCRTGTAAACGANVANTSTTLRASLLTTVPPAPTQPFANPVARVYYYYTHPGADATFATGDDYLVLIGSTDASAATVETSAATGERTFRFTNSLTAASLPAVGIFPIHAVAVDAQGDAILVSSTVDVR